MANVTTTVAVSPLSVAPGTESQGDKTAQLIKEQVAAAAAELRLRAEQAIGRVEQVLPDLFNGRHTEAVAILAAEVAKAQKAFEAGRHREVPGIVFRALNGAEAAVYTAESAELAEAIEELAAWPSLHGLKQSAETRLQRSYGTLGGNRPDFRTAIRMVREGLAIVERGLSNPTAAPKGTVDPGRAKRESARRARQLERSVGPKGPSGQQGPSNGKGQKGKK